MTALTLPKEMHDFYEARQEFIHHHGRKPDFLLMNQEDGDRLIFNNREFAFSYASNWGQEPYSVFGMRIIRSHDIAKGEYFIS